MKHSANIPTRINPLLALLLLALVLLAIALAMVPNPTTTRQQRYCTAR